MGHSPWFVGVDLGTGSCKSVVVDEKARVLGFGVAGYGGDEARDSWQEQDPRDLLAAVVTSVRTALAGAPVTAGNCAGFSLGGALHSVLALDRHGDPMTGVFTWADGRAVRQSRRVRDMPLASELYQATGCPVHAMYPLYKIMWLREMHPEVFEHAWRYVSAKEYVLSRLTGEYMVDYCLAAGSGLLNTHTLRWNALSLDLAGIREERLSALFPPLAIRDGLSRDLAREMGIPSSTPIVLGSSDAANSSLGAGAVASWQATCMVGTSGAFRVIAPRPVLDERARSWCYAVDEKHWLVGGSINNGGIALCWFRDFLNQASPRLPEGYRLSLEDVVALAGKADTGAGGVVCLPFFAGERTPRWNPDARAVFFGISLEHKAAHLSRSLLEATAFRLRTLREVLAEIGFDACQIVASGGFTKSPFWLQVVADVLNRELAVPKWGEGSSLGAAFWAILAAGKSRALEDLGGLVEMERSYHPNAVDAAIYDQLYPFYNRLYEALEGTFGEIAEVQRCLKETWAHGSRPLHGDATGSGESGG